MVVKLIAKNKNEKLQYEGRCKLIIDSVSKLLLVEPFTEEFKMISALFKWQFVASKNILFVFAEFNFQDFALIFDNTNVCNKAYNFLIEKGAISGNEQLIINRFLLPLFTEIPNNSESTLKMKEIFIKWIERFEETEKQVYIQLLKDNNVYDMIFPKKDENNTKIVRKRKFQCISSEVGRYVTDDTDVVGPPPKKASKKNAKYIYKPNFELLTYHQLKATRKRLFIFSSNDKTKCYEYYWDRLRSRYMCCGCTTKRIIVRAKVYKNSNGMHYVKLFKKQHICEMREYNPEKYIFDPSKDIVKKPNFELLQYAQNGIQKTILIIFCPTNKKLCYEYFWHKQRQLYYCYQCSKNYPVTAIIEKNEDGENFVKLNKNQHVCSLLEFDPSKYKNDFIIPKSMYNVAQHTVFGKKVQYFVVFTSAEKTKCYKFRYHKNNYYCVKCAAKKHFILAHIYKDKHGEEYLSIRNKEHICQPLEYSPNKFQDKIIKAPNYLLTQKKCYGKWIQKLIIFLQEDKKLCYEYSMTTGKLYVCNPCRNLKASVTAKAVKNENGEEYVHMGEREHLCQPVKYVPEDYTVETVRKSNFKIEKRFYKNTEMTYLFIFPSIESDLCYKYTLEKQDKRFHCQRCRKRCVTAKLLQDENSEDYIELGKTEHECQLMPFSISKIVKLPNFKVATDRSGKQLLYVFDENDETKCYIYVYQPSFKKFVCKKCTAQKRKVNAQLRQGPNGEDYLELGMINHICKAEKYTKY